MSNKDKEGNTFYDNILIHVNLFPDERIHQENKSRALKLVKDDIRQLEHDLQRLKDDCTLIEAIEAI